MFPSAWHPLGNASSKQPDNSKPTDDKTDNTDERYVFERFDFEKKSHAK